MKIKLSNFDLDKLIIEPNEYGGIAYFEDQIGTSMILSSKELTDLILAYNIQKALEKFKR